MDWINDKIDEYCRWLRGNMDAKQDLGTGWYVLSTPFIGLFNDHIQVYVRRTDSGILLSDDGETLDNLSMAGVDFNRSERRRRFLDQILNTYGVSKEGTELFVKSSEKEFPFKKHALVTAIMNIYDLETQGHERR